MNHLATVQIAAPLQVWEQGTQVPLLSSCKSFRPASPTTRQHQPFNPKSQTPQHMKSTSQAESQFPKFQNPSTWSDVFA